MSEAQRETLVKAARSQTALHREAVRAKALLAAADGVANTQIAADLGVTAVSVRAWRERFEAEGLAKWGKVRAGRGRKPSISEEQIAPIVDLTLHFRPDGQTHWSCRTMAAYVGVSPATVQRIWDARGLKPHRVETFKLSNDPKFEDKLVDVVELYLNPPDRPVSCAWTRIARFRPWTAPSRRCGW
jgi:transposase